VSAGPLLLFGAFDRHNFGDLLFPHVATALLEDEAPILAGLADRDLRGHGGHAVRGVARLAAELGDGALRILHVGGELLSCDAWEAAVMLCGPDEAREVVARLDARPAERRAWARQSLGLAAHAPYCLPRRLFPGTTRVVYNAVGGVALDACEPVLRAEVLAKLAEADLVTVRDTRSLDHLRAAGIAARLAPDSVVMVAELFGERIARHAAEGEVAALRTVFPQGWLAVQFSADFGDDATLDAIAGQLRRVLAETGLAAIFFRAGAAPWHDELDVYRRVAARLPDAPVGVFTSLDVWDICALIAESRAYVGSGLHGRIVAMACALPRVNLVRAGAGGKQAAYAETWEGAGVPGVVACDGLAEGVSRALGVEAGEYRRIAAELVRRYRKAFGVVRQVLG